MNVFEEGLPSIRNQPVYFRVSGVDCGDDVSKWLTSFLKQECRLIRQNPNVVRRIDSNLDDCSHALSLANNSQLVVITEESCLDLLGNMKSFAPDEETCEPTVESLIQRFRPNVVISGVNAYEEEYWSSVAIGSSEFQCCGVCFRCQMISVDPRSGERSKEPMRTLAKLRGSKIPFGVHLQQILSERKMQLRVGSVVRQIFKNTQNK